MMLPHSARHFFFALLLLSVCALKGQSNTFLRDQLKYPRVRQAFAQKEEALKTLFSAAKADWPPKNLFIRGFKARRMLEVWSGAVAADTLCLVHRYEFCASSGTLGPKLRQGDYQIPEGVYRIERFNPASSYHLSLGLNYPNAADRIRGYGPALGGDIFIHGDCVTIGCIPITDDKIKELYVIAVRAKAAGQKNLYVHIYPMDFRQHDVCEKLYGQSQFKHWHELWQQLKSIQMWFEQKHRLPTVMIDLPGGTYKLVP